MTSDPSHRPISALRARMIEDMYVRGFTEKTRNGYIRNVGRSQPSSAALLIREHEDPWSDPMAPADRSGLNRPRDIR